VLEQALNVSQIAELNQRKKPHDWPPSANVLARHCPTDSRRPDSSRLAGIPAEDWARSNVVGLGGDPSPSVGVTLSPHRPRQPCPSLRQLELPAALASRNLPQSGQQPSLIQKTPALLLQGNRSHHASVHHSSEQRGASLGSEPADASDAGLCH